MASREAASGKAALAYLQEEEFDLATLDLQMPEMDGLMLAEEIRRNLSAEKLPLVLLTSLGNHISDERLRFFATLLTKPIKTSALYNALINVMAGEMTQLYETELDQLRSDFDVTLAQRYPLRILLAEDNITNQKLALLTLDRLGYRADVVSNGLEVLEAVARRPYDLILMDVQMPEMDGLESTRRIREQYLDAKRPFIVALTANAAAGDRDHCLAAGMNDYIRKPFHVRELIDVIERCIPDEMGEPMPISRTIAPVPKADESGNDAPLATIDKTAVSKTKAMLGSQADLVFPELLDSFYTDVQRLIEKLQTALAEKELNAFQNAGHTLRSNALSFGANRLAHFADLAEETTAWNNAPNLIEDIKEEFVRVQHELKEL